MTAGALLPLWSAPFIEPHRRIDASVTVPGSKSLTNRAFILAAQSTNECVIDGALDSRDTRLMADALEQLGCTVDWDSTGSARVRPSRHTMGEARAHIDCGLAGTVMRFVPALCAAAGVHAFFDGDEGARVRPLDALLSALTSAGARITCHGEPGFLPFELDGIPADICGSDGVTNRHAPMTIDVDTHESSQFASALLLSAPLLATRMNRPVQIRLTGRVVSLPHIQMSVRTLQEWGVTVRSGTDEGGLNGPDSATCGSTTPTDAQAPSWIIEPELPILSRVAIEPDLSNAGPFIAAALVTGGQVRIPHWPVHTTQPGDAFRQIAQQMGGQVNVDADGILCVKGPERGRLLGVDRDMSDIGELTPTVAALAAVASTESHLSGISHLRGHETDRVSALRTEIERLGGDVTEHPDALTIRPRALHAADLHTYHDHRMAMLGAIIGLVVDGVRVFDIGTTGKTLPDFVALWQATVASAESGDQ